MTSHLHADIGGGYCACGAERCSLRPCDGWCCHPGGWVEPAELAELRRITPEVMAAIIGGADFIDRDAVLAQLAEA